MRSEVAHASSCRVLRLTSFPKSKDFSRDLRHNPPDWYGADVISRAAGYGGVPQDPTHH
jgi:hypothetical protein